MLTVLAVLTGLAGPVVDAGPAAAGSTWPGYHADRARTGFDRSEPSLYPAERAWSANLGGAVYGQPVVADGRVYAATEGDRVVALDPHTGRVLWSRSIGKPVTGIGNIIGCGNVDPLGITSTPVVDTTTNTVYAVGEISTGGDAVHHQLVGFDAFTGAVTTSIAVDPPLPSGESDVTLLQRAALALGNGRVYVSFGGHYGDCGRYHGWVVGVDTAGPARAVSFEVAGTGEGGAIWEAGGGPAIDAAGNLYVTTGNANPDPPQGGPDPQSYTESVVRLTPGLRPTAGFKDRVAGGDEDLSTGNPVLLPHGRLFAVGKTDIGFVLTQATLSQVATIPGICGSDPDGGPAFDAATDTLFVPCADGGIQQVDLSRNRLGPKLSGANGAPILVGHDLWAAQYPSGTLTEYDARNGTTLQKVDAGPVPTFATPSAALGLLLIGTRTGVTAFRGPTGLPAPAPAAPTEPAAPAAPAARTVPPGAG